MSEPIAGFIRRHRWYVAAALGTVVVVCVAVLNSVCVPLWFKGLSVPMCPDGEIRQVAAVEAPRLRRGHEERILIGANAMFARGTEVGSGVVTRGEGSLSLVDGQGKETVLADAKAFHRQENRFLAHVKVPEVADGDYVLRARIKTAFGESQVDAPVSFYAPARVHVITDRPLYQPGNTIRFRALVLRARDLAPLESRPGKWMVTDPTGQVVLEDRAPSGAWGVTSGSFPLDKGAPTGTWKVRWSSGEASDEVPVQVQPFTLPRFRVEAHADKPFYRPGEQPKLSGAVTYSSGAPVANAKVTLEWSHEGAWPPPTEWDAGGLPKEATTNKAGAFELTLPLIPGDLRGQVTLNAYLRATDSTGDVVTGAASVLLSEDGIQASAVTELAGGLVEGFNNRLYLRVTDPSGVVLPGAEVRVRRAWDETDEGISAVADEDGVAALQLDPGPAVNIVIPPMPHRLPPPRPAVSRTDLTDLLTEEEAPLSIARALDSVQPSLESCARFVRGHQTDVAIDLHIDGAGRTETSSIDSSPATDCVSRILQSLRVPAGQEDLLAVTYALDPPQVPDLTATLPSSSQAPAAVQATLDVAAMDARSCLPRALESGVLPEQFFWRVERDSKAVSGRWLKKESGVRVPDPVMDCVRRRLANVRLDKPAEKASFGVVRFEVTAVPRTEAEAPQATTMLGYELLVSARVDGREVGATRLRMQPGQVPPVRLRATPVLAKAGETVEVQLIRGPSFSGSLPTKLVLHGLKASIESKVDAQTRTARFHLPPDAEGWYSVAWNAATARVFVKPRNALTVAVEPDKPRYAPGQKARLTVRTAMNGVGAQAGVGLIGVDESLGQLVPLPGADALARLRPAIAMDGPAFPALDGQALTMGRVRGANAAAAIVTQVGVPPELPALDVPTRASAVGSFDAAEELTEAFYVVLTELHAQVRDWEQHVKPGEQMHPATMVRLWQQAIAACEKRGERVTDAFHRRLRLSLLPPDLLALTDPREVVVDGAHLPEDIENWPAYVAKEKP